MSRFSLVLLFSLASAPAAFSAPSQGDPTTDPSPTSKLRGLWSTFTAEVTKAKAATTVKAQRAAGRKLYTTLTTIRSELKKAQRQPGTDKKAASQVVAAIDGFIASGTGFVTSAGFNSARPSLLGPGGLVVDWGSFDNASTALNPSRTY